MGLWFLVLILATTPVQASVDEALIRARERERAGDLHGAVRILESAHAGDPMALNQLGLLYAKTGAFDRAVQTFRQVMARDAGNLFAQLWLGIALMARDDLPGAFDAFHRLSQIAPKDEEQRYFLANAYYFLGAIYSFRRENALALRALEAGRQANPRDDETRYRLGALYHRLGQLELAAAEYRAALGLNARHIKSRNALGWMAYNEGHIAQARAQWRQSLTFSPQNAEARDGLAKSYNDEALAALNRGQKEGARRLWQQALTYDAQNKAAAFYLGKYR